MDYTDIYVVVLKIYIFKIFMAIIVLRDWKIFNLDVITIFLYRFINKKIYVKQLKGFSVKGKENYIYKFKRSLYKFK